eukprot:CAMPEP_0172838516 /NCGR_PEP_ID=MMETSP1075-20121228/27930_1 /TAXON_ID=2916 /ORGANISM="Ceratium fusus, Strain PA161109" /LENGTH=458 /DNA_ID=CAMNT_0013682037 /DNA_START=11 /DNA_END=1384 /DNA_ORIENTATION=-
MGAAGQTRDNFRKAFRHQNKLETGFCLVELVFLVLTALFALIGMMTLRGASPHVWQSKRPCGTKTNSLESKAECGPGEKSGTCYLKKDNGMLSDNIMEKEACPTDMALKGCRVYSSNVEVFSESYSAKGEVKVPLVDKKFLEWGKASTEWDHRCGFTNKCTPVSSLLHMEDHPYAPVPEALIWLIYKLIGLAPVIFEITFLTCMCKTQEQELGVLKGITSFGSGFLWFLPVGSRIRSCLHYVNNLIDFLKFKVMPNLIFAEISGMEGHPECDEMVLARVVPGTAGAAYVGLFLYTLWSMLVYIVFVYCVKRPHMSTDGSKPADAEKAGDDGSKPADADGDESQEKADGDDSQEKADGDDSQEEVKRVLAISNKNGLKGFRSKTISEKFLAACMCFMLVFDLVGLIVIIVHYAQVLKEMGGIVGFNFAMGFSFNIGIAVTIDIFQLMFLFLSVIEMTHW